MKTPRDMYPIYDDDGDDNREVVSARPKRALVDDRDKQPPGHELLRPMSYYTSSSSSSSSSSNSSIVNITFISSISSIMCITITVLLLWSVRGTLWRGYTACDAVSTMHEWGGEHTRRAWALFR